MGTAWRSYMVVPGIWTDWMAAPFYTLRPNSTRTMEFSFTQPFSSATQRRGHLTPPIEFEFRYPKNGQFVTQTYVLPPGGGKIPIETSSADEKIWGQIKYRIKSIGLPTAVSQRRKRVR